MNTIMDTIQHVWKYIKVQYRWIGICIWVNESHGVFSEYPKNDPPSLFGVKISPRCKNIESKEGQLFKINNIIKII